MDIVAAWMMVHMWHTELTVSWSLIVLADDAQHNLECDWESGGARQDNYIISTHSHHTQIWVNVLVKKMRTYCLSSSWENLEHLNIKCRQSAELWAEDVL